MGEARLQRLQSRYGDAALPRSAVRADAQRNREAIIAAARSSVDSGTFYEIRFDDFASLAGLGVGTLYRHFPTRDALAEAVFQREVEALCARASDLQATLPANEALAAFLRAMVTDVYANQGLARTLSTVITTGSQALSEGGRALEEAVANLVAAGAEDGTIREDITSGSIMIALHAVGAGQDRANWRAEAEGLVTLIIEGVQPR